MMLHVSLSAARLSVSRQSDRRHAGRFHDADAVGRWPLSSCCRWLSALGLVLLLSGCASTREGLGKAWQVIKDPSTPVGEVEDRPSRLDLSMVADDDVNAGDEEEGTPLRFQVLMLKDDSMLMAADISELSEDLEGALGTNYLAHDDYTLLPGQFKFIESFELDEEVRYVGLIAFFSDPDQADWKKVVRVRSRGEHYHLLIHLRSQDIRLEREDS